MQTKIIIISAALLLIPACAMAQSPSSPATPPARTAPSDTVRGSQNCVPSQTVPQQGTIAPQASGPGQTQEPLTDRLARSDGVICPPSDVDPQIRTTVPNAGGSNMPVIPPPGSPGGDPTVRPR